MLKYSARHTERLLTRYETCWNITECHACHLKSGYATFEASKYDRFYSTRYRHCHRCPQRGHPRTVANIKAASSEPVSTPRPAESKTRTLRHAVGKTLWFGALLEAEVFSNVWR